MASISNHLSEVQKRLLESFVPQPTNKSSSSKPKKRYLRVHEIASEFSIESKLVCQKLKEINEPVKGPSSTVISPVYRKLKAALESDGYVSTIIESSPQVVTEGTPELQRQEASPTSKTPRFKNITNAVKPRKHGPKGFAFEKHLLDLELKRFRLNPTKSSKDKCLDAYKKLFEASNRNAQPAEKQKLLKSLYADAEKFRAANLPARKNTVTALAQVEKPSGNKALKPYVSLRNKTPNGPLSESYWDNPLQDK